MNWNLLMYITLVILIAVLMYMFREKYHSIFTADNNTNDEQADANVNKQSAPPENKEMNNENIKKAALGEVEKQFVDAALDRTKKHGLKKRGHDRAVEALDVFDNLMAQSMSLSPNLLPLSFEKYIIKVDIQSLGCNLEKVKVFLNIVNCILTISAEK